MVMLEQPRMTKLDSSRVASVDDLDSAEFYVLHSLAKPPVLAAVTYRQEMLNGTRDELDSVGYCQLQI